MVSIVDLDCGGGVSVADIVHLDGGRSCLWWRGLGLVSFAAVIDTCTRINPPPPLPT